MPFTRIALPAGKSQQFQRCLSEILHQTLVDFFDVPDDDRFQLFDYHPPVQRIFAQRYLGGPRSADFIWFHVTAGRPRDVEQKRRFYHYLVQRLQQQLGVRPQDVMITLVFNQQEDWSFANGELFDGLPGGAQ